MNRIVSVILAGLAGGIAWIVGMSILFMPAQAILADPALQSPKFLAVFMDSAHPPHMATTPWAIPLGLMLISQIYAFVYATIQRGLPGRTPTGRGVAFGLVAWALAFTWFEFYLPWNVMLEPVALVAVELACWLGVMLLVGLSIAWTCSLAGNDGGALNER